MTRTLASSVTFMVTLRFPGFLTRIYCTFTSDSTTLASMNDTGAMILHLYADVPYRNEIVVPADYGTAYDYVLKAMDALETASDASILCEARPGAECIEIKTLTAGYTVPSDISDKELFSMPKGSYHFKQLPFTPPKGSDLKPLVFSFIASTIDWSCKASHFIIRLFKERTLEVVVQFFLPLKSKEE